MRGISLDRTSHFRRHLTSEDISLQWDRSRVTGNHKQVLVFTHTGGVLSASWQISTSVKNTKPFKKEKYNKFPHKEETKNLFSSEHCMIYMHFFFLFFFKIYIMLVWIYVRVSSVFYLTSSPKQTRLKKNAI